MLSNFTSRFALVTLALTLVGAAAHSADTNNKTGNPEIKVFPPEAISAAMRYEKKTFLEMYPGIDVTRTGITDEGFYVRYEHEFMVLFFGPIETVEEGVKYRGDMDYLRSELLKKKPELETSTVMLVRVDHSRHQGPPKEVKSATAAAK